MTYTAVDTKIYPCDPCVVNKIIHGSQMTATWYVDDLKLSHASLTVLSDVMMRLKTIYGTLTASRDHTHSYISMGLDYT